MADAAVDAHALKLFEAASKMFDNKVQNDLPHEKWTRS
jgi:hypothetical protein